MKYLVIGLTALLISCQSENKSFEKVDKTNVSETSSGEDLYAEYCLSCHGVDGKLGLSGASDLNTSSLSAEKIKNVLVNGRNGMPAMKEILGTRKNMDSVVNYIIRLR